MPSSDNGNSGASRNNQARTDGISATTMIFANDLQGIKLLSFNWDSSDLSNHFNTFKRCCQLILSTPTYASKSDKEVVNYILLWMGP